MTNLSWTYVLIYFLPNTTTGTYSPMFTTSWTFCPHVFCHTVTLHIPQKTALPFLQIVPFFPPCAKNKYFAYKLIFTYTPDIFTCSFLVSADSGGVYGNEACMGPPLSSFPHMGTWDRGQSININFTIILTSLPLSTILQGGNRELSWLGSPLMFVLTHARGGDEGHGPFLADDIATFI